MTNWPGDDANLGRRVSHNLADRLDTAHVIAAPPVMLGTALVVAALLHAAIPISIVSDQRTLIRLVGGALIAIGAALSAWVVQAFRAAATPVSPGRPTTRLVHSGPYRYSRNPD